MQGARARRAHTKVCNRGARERQRSRGRKGRARGQARKSTRWMPWHRKPKKDVTSCEKLRGGANIRRSADIRMRELSRGNARLSPGEYIAWTKGTRGTETSKYPQEKKEKIDFLSSGERTGNRPNRQFTVGVADCHSAKEMYSRRGLERHTKEGKGPVDEIQLQAGQHQSSAKHEEFGVKPGGPPPKPKY